MLKIYSQVVILVSQWNLNCLTSWYTCTHVYDMGDVSHKCSLKLKCLWLKLPGICVFGRSTMAARKLTKYLKNCLTSVDTCF